MTRRKPKDWFVCPVCGEEVPADALACPGCGSDDRTGWSAETDYDGLDLPEAGPDRHARPDGRRPGRSARGAWIVLGAAILAAVLLLLEALRVL